MKKLSTRIVLTVLICSISMSVLVGATSIFRSKNIFEKEAKENLLATGEIRAGEFNEELKVCENVCSSLYELVQGTIDVSRLEEADYLSNYSNTILNDTLEGVAREVDRCAGTYVAIDSKYTGRTEGAWAGLNENGNIVRSLPTNLVGISEDDPTASY